ncbi:MAG: ATP synthase F1 subunit delta [Trichlorobacter sp.]
MINNAIARRYAKALVQLGSENGLIERFSQELKAINDLVAGNAELRAAFGNPAFTAEQKKQIMRDLIVRLQSTELVANFLLLLVDKKRVAFLSQIVETYEKLADLQSGVIRPVITTAFALDDAQIASIKGALEQKTGKKVLPQVTVDQSLIGGVLTQIGDIAYDSSVKSQLARINDILQKG